MTDGTWRTLWSVGAVTPRQRSVATAVASTAFAVSSANAKSAAIHSDHLNTPRALANLQLQGGQPSGTVVWRWNLNQLDANGSNAFGAQSDDTNPDGNAVHTTFRLRFPGRLHDQASGLHYIYFRDYEAGTGRYVESDPIGLGGGLATFAYARGQPISNFDAFGLKPGDRFKSARAAAQDAIEYAWTLPSLREYCGQIKRAGNCYTYHEPVHGTPDSCDPGVPGPDDVEEWHIHPLRNPPDMNQDDFSSDDIARAEHPTIRRPSNLGGGSEKTHRRYDPDTDKNTIEPDYGEECQCK